MHQKNSCFCVRKLGIPPSFCWEQDAQPSNLGFLDFQANPSSRILGTAHSTSKKKHWVFLRMLIAPLQSTMEKPRPSWRNVEKSAGFLLSMKWWQIKKKQNKGSREIHGKKSKKMLQESPGWNCWYCRAMVSCPTLHRKQSQVTRNWLASEPELTKNTNYI